VSSYSSECVEEFHEIRGSKLSCAQVTLGHRGGAMRLIHPTAWNGDSQKFVKKFQKILHLGDALLCPRGVA
jgi:hypothetical protein